MDRKLFGHRPSLGMPKKDPAGKNSEIALRLRAIMVVENHRTQDAFAEALGVEKKRVNNPLVGYPLSIEVANRLRKTIPGMTRDWLYDGDEAGMAVSLRDALREALIKLKAGSLAS